LSPDEIERDEGFDALRRAYARDRDRYLVVGSGASAMAFTDALLAAWDARGSAILRPVRNEEAIAGRRA
jgi:hypothetical protein